MNALSELPILGVGRDEGDEADLSGHGEQLCDLGDSADVFGTVLSGEAQVLVESLSDDISIEDKHLLLVAEEAVDALLECLGES